MLLEATPHTVVIISMDGVHGVNSGIFRNHTLNRSNIVYAKQIIRVLWLQDTLM